MKPAPFEYFAPSNAAEALELTHRFASTQKVLAGGQSLVPLMNMRLARPEQVIDLNRIGGLDGIAEEDGALVIGALTRQRALEESELVRSVAPLLREAVGQIGHVQIRSRGTIGGSLAHADPAAELPAVLVAYGGRLSASSISGARTIDARDFFVSTFTTSLAEDEVLTKISFDKPRNWNGWAFTEVARRHGDFALVSCAVLLAIRGATISDVRIVLGSVADRPIRMEQAEAMLRGVRLEAMPNEAIAAAVREAIDPVGDVHASSDYKRHVSGVLALRSLAIAVNRAQADGQPAPR